MDVHLRELFEAFQQQFGVRPGLGPGVCPALSKVDNLSTPFLKAVFRAAAALYRSNPWKNLRPSHILGVRVGKETEWSDGRPPFYCVQFVGGSGGDDLGLNLFQTEEDVVKASSLRGTGNLKSIPKQGFLRVVYGPEAELSSGNRKLVKSLGLEIAGDKAYPVIDVVYSTTDKVRHPSFRNPSSEELRWLYGCLRAMTEISDKLSAGLSPEDMMQYVDIQWPAGDRREWEIICVKVSCPPKEEANVTIESQPSGVPKLSSDAFEEAVSFDWSAPRECTACQKEVSADKAPRCSRCKAVIYCSQACQKKHWKESHKGNCELYKAMMDREEELEIKGFGFPCFVESPCKWLDMLGLHGKGMWRRICNCFKQCPFGLLPPSEGSASVAGGAWGVEEGYYPVDEDITEEGSGTLVVLSGWREYYELRRLPLDSPVAVLLTYPLSLYHIITALNPSTKNLLAKNREVVVHYLGPEAELDLMAAFMELSHLLGISASLHIIMVGPEVPGSLSGMTEVLEQRVRVSYVQGLYQDQLDSLPAPHIVIALNAALETDGNWMGALEAVKSLGVPAFFTDYAETCCLNAKQVLRSAGLHISHPLTPNPFRSPIRNQMVSINVPWFSNGFVLGVNT